MKKGNYKGFWIIIALAAVIGLTAGCDSPTGPEAEPRERFVAVSSITNVPTSGTVGNLTLTGTVNPLNATNKTIVWSVVNTRGTGAYINGNTLTTTAAGIVMVRATIANGLAKGTNYTQNFDITINPAGSNPSGITYTVDQIGGENGETDSTGILFFFSADVESLGLTATDITVSGAAEKGSAILTLSENVENSYVLSPITVNAAGLAIVSIDKTGIETGAKYVSVHKQGQTTPEYWSITWHLNGGVTGMGEYPTQIEKGEILAKPSPDPTKAGSDFDGWYTDSGLAQAYDFTNPVTEDLNLYVKWEVAVQPPAGTPVSGSTLVAKLAWVLNANNIVDGQTYAIEVTANESINPHTLSYTSRSNITILLWGNVGEKLVSLSQNGSLFTIASNVTLVLDRNITLRGRSNNTVSLVRVNSGGKLIMNTGAKIAGNTTIASGSRTNRSYGGGVYVNSGGIFTMNGGEISGNTVSASNPSILYQVDNYSYGGGVYVNSGTFTMAGGKISGNTSYSNSYTYSYEQCSAHAESHGGGVYVSENGTFTMSGGEISGNASSSAATAAPSAYSESDGGGVYVSKNGTFIMSNGEIFDNEVRSTNGNFSSNTHGAGVSLEGTFTMEGGKISSNTATSNSPRPFSSGGGVYIYYGGTFTMNGGEISGNIVSSSSDGGMIGHSSSYGGGVYISGAFIMNKGEISGNKVISSNGNYSNAYSSGGGVYINGTVTINGGEISGNTATASSSPSTYSYSSGGGVYIGSGTLTMNRGEISGNTASSGGGIYVGGQFTIGGTSQIYGNTNGSTNNNVYLPDGKYITLGNGSNKPAYGMNVYVQTTATNGVIAQSGATAEATQYFHADYAGYEVIYQDTQLVIGELCFIVWNFNDGTVGISAQHPSLIKKGTVLAKPSPDPSKANNIFGGWYTDSALTQQYNFANPVTTNLNLYAKWKNIFSITWHFNSGTAGIGAQHPAQIEEGMVLAKPSPDPNKADYVFDGWYKDSNLTQTYNFANPVIANLNLYAKWREFNLMEKLAWILNENNVQDGQAYTIEVKTDEALSPHTLSYKNRNNITIILQSSGGEKIISLSQNGSLFIMGNGVTLVLKNNITLLGRNNNNNELVRVYSGGELIMNTGTKISGNRNISSSTPGCGVRVYNGGTFTMNGGEISGNTTYSTGGGVYVSENGTFTMNGGEISGNTTYSTGGGVYVDRNSIFTMIDGTISNNIATDDTTYGRGGGGVYINNTGKFTMEGGTISGNIVVYNNNNGGGGVFAERNAIFTKIGGTINGYSAGDTSNSNIVKNSNGTVLNNKGHAVYVDSNPAKRRETTAGPEVSLDSTIDGTAGGWEN